MVKGRFLFYSRHWKKIFFNEKKKNTILAIILNKIATTFSLNEVLRLLGLATSSESFS